MRIKEMATIAALCVCAMPMAMDQTPATAQQKAPKPRVAGKKAEKAKADLTLRLEEVKALKAEATEVTKKIGELASSGKLPQDPAGIKLMQDMVEQLKQINERMTKIEGQVADVQAYIDGEKAKPKPDVEKDLSALKRTKVSGYVQTQYRDSDLPGQNDGFRMRRVRLNVNHTIDPQASLKVSFDLASSQFGSSFNEPTESTGQLKDAFITYNFQPELGAAGLTGIMGRQTVPVGYELERSDADNELPERSQYNQLLFSGERSTGIQFRRAFAGGLTAYAGGFNALTFNDPQQRAIPGPPGNRLAVVGGVRYASGNLNAGVSGFFGKRASQFGTAPLANPTNDRRFVYVDGTYTAGKAYVRAEAMFGHDRLPTAAATANNEDHDMTGGHLQAGYFINPKNQINVRYEMFDPNTDSSGDRLTALGVSYLHYLKPNLRLMLAHEMFNDDARTTKEKYGITTLRVQFRF